MSGSFSGALARLRRGLVPVVVLAVGAGGAVVTAATPAAAAATSVTVAGTGTGDIPDNDPTGRTVSFAVSGASAPITGVEISLTLTHTFAGDLVAYLEAPDGTRADLFGRIGAGSVGTSGDFDGTYTFTDSASTVLTVSTNRESPAPGTYRAGGVRTGNGSFDPPIVDLAATFGTRPPNGTWKLVVADVVIGDRGPISAATLKLTSGDSVAPTITIDGPVDGTGVSKAPRYTFSSDAADLAGFECSVDDGAYTGCTSPYDVSINGLANNTSHTFRVRAIDTSTNRSTAATRTFVIDKSAPQLTLTPPTSIYLSSAPSFTFSSTSGDLARFECRLDSDAFSTCTSPLTYSSLSQGEHTVTVRAVDRAGNTSESSFTFTYDTTAPAAPTITAPAARTRSAVVTFTGEANATFECRTTRAGATAGAYAACTSPYTAATTGDGSYTVDVRAKDRAGNRSDAASRSFELDTTGPVLTVTPEADQRGKTAPTYTFASESNATYSCDLDGDVSTCTSPYTPDVSALGDGPHELKVVASDDLGNASAAVVRRFTVDTTAPDLAVGGTADNAAVNAAPSYQATTTATDGVTITCQLGSATAVDCGTTYSPDVTGLADGSHTVTFVATDSSGNATSTTRTFVLDRVAPTLTVTPGAASAPVNTLPTFSIASEDGATRVCTFDTQVVGCTNGYTVPSGVSEGDHEFVVEVTDAAGNVARATRAFTYDATAPEAEFGADSTADATRTNTAPSYVVTSPETVTFTCELDDVTVPCTVPSAVARRSGSSVTFTPPTAGLGQGGHRVDITARDAAGNPITLSRTFVWDTDGPVTLFAGGPADASVLVSSPTYTFGSTATDLAGFRCAVDDPKALTACTSPVALGSLALGTHTFYVQATDDLGNAGNIAQRVFTLVSPTPVDTTGPTTTITSGPQDQEIVTSVPTFTFTSADADLAGFTCAVDTGAFAACSSPFTLPTPLAAGLHTFSVRASDRTGNQGPVAARTFTYRPTSGADTVAPTVRIVKGPKDGASVKRAPRYTFTSDDTDVAGFECAVDKAEFTSCTSPLRLPATLKPGTHVFNVLAVDTSGNRSTVVSRTVVLRDMCTPAKAKLAKVVTKLTSVKVKLRKARAGGDADRVSVLKVKKAKLKAKKKRARAVKVRYCRVSGV